MMKLAANSFKSLIIALVLYSGLSIAKENPRHIVSGLSLSSPAFSQGTAIPGVFTCDDRNINPPLRIGNVPTRSKSLALIVDDPDAPRGDWVHWLVWNISPATRILPQQAKLAGVLTGVNSFSHFYYDGPCPPQGRHRYFFRLYALDTRLTLPKTTSRQILENAMQGHILATATLMGTYTH